MAARTAVAVLALTAVLPSHALLVQRDGFRVYGPSRTCPTLLPLPREALSTVKRAVTLAMPPFEHAVKLDGRDPIVDVGPASRSGYSPAAGGCGRLAWARSIVASVRLPHVTSSASMSEHTFAVGRARDGWVLWAQIH
jgi:hypothetical protein